MTCFVNRLTRHDSFIMTFFIDQTRTQTTRLIGISTRRRHFLYFFFSFSFPYFLISTSVYWMNKERCFLGFETFNQGHFFPQRTAAKHTLECCDKLIKELKPSYFCVNNPQENLNFDQSCIYFNAWYNGDVKVD